MFKKGAVIENMSMLDDEVSAGKYIFLWERPVHPGFIQSMQYRILKQYVNQKKAFTSTINEEWINGTKNKPKGSDSTRGL